VLIGIDTPDIVPGRGSNPPDRDQERPDLG
jgi:hypothetical protein